MPTIREWAYCSLKLDGTQRLLQGKIESRLLVERQKVYPACADMGQMRLLGAGLPVPLQASVAAWKQAARKSSCVYTRG